MTTTTTTTTLHSGLHQVSTVCIIFWGLSCGGLSCPSLISANHSDEKGEKKQPTTKNCAFVFPYGCLRCSFNTFYDCTPTANYFFITAVAFDATHVLHSRLFLSTHTFLHLMFCYTVAVRACSFFSVVPQRNQ